MSKSGISALLVILAIGIGIGAFVLVIKPKRESISSLESEISTLQARYNDLVAKESQYDELIAETEQANQEFDDEVNKYAPDLEQENTLMFLKEIEENLEFTNTSVSLPRSSYYYIIGTGDTETVGSVDEGAVAESEYVCEVNKYSIAYTGSYDGFKEYLDYIANYKYRMAISDMSVAYASDAEDVTQQCSGSITLNEYAIVGDDRAADVPTISVETGKEVIFAAEGAAAAAAAVSYDSDEGESIVASHNLVMLINAADNDAASAVIVASDEGNEDTYVTSNDNDTVAVDVTVYEDSEKYYILYSIGSSSYEEEVTSSDVTIYVKSSSRVDSSDAVSVDLSINNSTDLGVFIKVADDDTSNPRFNLAGKTGTVKVY